MRTSFLFALLLAACGSDPVDEDAAKPTSCSEADRVGTYRLSWDEQSGNCGAIPDTLVMLPGSSECTIISGPAYSANGCKWSINIICPFDGQASDARMESTAVLEQRDERGDVVTGTVTISTDDFNPCVGTYAVRYERQ